MRISESELEIMRVIWNMDHKVTAQEIMQEMAYKEWKITTVLTFLTRLCDKGILDFEKRKGRTNYYFPLMTKADYQSMATANFVDQIHGGSVESLFAALCKGKNLKKADIDELTKWMEEQ